MTFPLILIIEVNIWYRIKKNITICCLSLTSGYYQHKVREMLIRTTTVLEREKLKPSKFDIFRIQVFWLTTQCLENILSPLFSVGSLLLLLATDPVLRHRRVHLSLALRGLGPRLLLLLLFLLLLLPGFLPVDDEVFQPKERSLSFSLPPSCAGTHRVGREPAFSW